MERPRRHTRRTSVAGERPATVTIAELVSSGAGVLAICADASRRAALASGASGLARFNGGSGRVACARCGSAALDGLLTRAESGFALTDYATLEIAAAGSAANLGAAADGSNLAGALSTARFEHVILVDPPPSSAAAELAASGSGFLHDPWTEAEIPFSLLVLAEQLASRETVAGVFRALREAGEVSGAQLRAALAGPGTHPLAPEPAARSFRVLSELDLISGTPDAGDGVVGVVSSGGTDLERSAAFRAYSEDFSEAKRFLERPKLP